MTMMTDAVVAPWAAVNTALGLSQPLDSAARYSAMLAFVDECFERFGADDSHPIFTLVALVSERIRDYEERMHPWPDASTPATRLAFLMEQHGLRQGELPEVGAQSVVSALLAGKRSLNLRQAQALARRFGVPLDALV